MSIESAKAFIERMKTDEEFRNSVGEIATAEERMEYVKGAGFDFTKGELDEITDELTDEQLRDSSGGVGYWICCGMDSNDKDKNLQQDR